MIRVKHKVPPLRSLSLRVGRNDRIIYNEYVFLCVSVTLL